MASKHRIILRVCLCGLVFLGSIPQSGAAPETAPPDIRWVPEMERVVELAAPAAGKTREAILHGRRAAESKPYAGWCGTRELITPGDPIRLCV